VLFGATGFSGELAARALVKRGQVPILAGRNANKLSQLAAELGGLEYAVADVEYPQSVSGLVGRGDVLVSTVGPYTRWGETAVQAAVGRGAHYIDCTGEPPFIRDVFENWSAPARAAGCALITAMAAEYVPGNLAAALALRDAGPAATRVEVGYFSVGPSSLSPMSGGTLASLTGVLFDSGLVRRGGVVIGERAGLRHRTFDVLGTRRSAVSLGASEHFTLPQTFPYLQEVDTYLGWFGRASRPISFLSRTGGALVSLPPIRTVANSFMHRSFRGSTGGPTAEALAEYRTVAVAEAFDRRGVPMGRAVVQGPNAYDFTGEILAWAADRVANVGALSVGALGPVSAFGLDELVEGVRQSGMKRIE
jgi:short subunit dehydrogenase-like uncharacterized protein